MRILGRHVCGRRLIAAVWLAGVLDASMPVSAKDLGVWGEVWPIEESDLLEQVEDTLEALPALRRMGPDGGGGEGARPGSGSKPRRRYPASSPAVEPRNWLYDPAIVVQEDVVGPGGVVIAPAGTRIEPLAQPPA